MYISFFIGSMVRGGAERVIQLLANHFVQSGWKVDIVLLLSNEVNSRQFPLDKNIHIIDLSGDRSSYKKNAVSWLRAVRKYVKNNKPDCIVSFIGRINALVLTAVLGLNIPIIVSERNDPRHDGRSKIMLTYCNLIYHRARLIVFQTEYESRCFAKSLKHKSIVIPNPVSVEQINGSETERNLICTAGRLATQKNHLMLIDSMKLLKEKIPTIKCEIYGDGPEKQLLQQRIEELQLGHTVSLAGQKTDVHKWIAKSQVFVLTSEYEGQSNALIEAMMLGKPVITTDYPGADEVVQNNISGLIVPRGDVKALADAVLLLLENKVLYDKLRKGALIKAQEYKSDIVLGKCEKAIINHLSDVSGI